MAENTEPTTEFGKLRKRYAAVRPVVKSSIQKSLDTGSSRKDIKTLRKGAFIATEEMKGKVEEAEKLRHEAEERSLEDPVTGLGSYRGLVERLRSEVERAKRTGESVAVIYFDLDNFKIINDTYGHDEGDNFLKQIGELLNHRREGGESLSPVRSVDYISRPGGDEFCIVLPNIKEGLGKVAERLRKVIEANPQISAYKLDNGIITASIGATIAVPSKGDDTEKFMKRMLKEADIALYNAKSAGKNNFVIYQPGMQMPENYGRFRSSS